MEKTIIDRYFVAKILYSKGVTQCIPIEDYELIKRAMHFKPFEDHWFITKNGRYDLEKANSVYLYPATEKQIKTLPQSYFLVKQTVES